MNFGRVGGRVGEEGDVLCDARSQGTWSWAQDDRGIEMGPHFTGTIEVREGAFTCVWVSYFDRAKQQRSQKKEQEEELILTPSQCTAQRYLKSWKAYPSRYHMSHRLAAGERKARHVLLELLGRTLGHLLQSHEGRDSAW